MLFIDEVATDRNKRNIKNLATGAIETVEITSAATVTTVGTPVNAENLNKGNWRDDNSLSFKTREGNLPPKLNGETQIVTLTNGETWVIPPSNTIASYRLGDAVSSGGSSQPSLSMNDVINLIYPVGAIYMSTTSGNPSSRLGGSWVAWGAGRVPIGVGSNGETSYAYADITGGSETVTLTTNQIPSHNHSGSSQAASAQSGNFRNAAYNNIDHQPKGIASGSSIQNVTLGTSGGSCIWSTTITVPSHNHTVTVGSTGGGGSHNNMQPYVTCYMWKRTA